MLSHRINQFISLLLVCSLACPLPVSANQGGEDFVADEESLTTAQEESEESGDQAIDSEAEKERRDKERNKKKFRRKIRSNCMWLLAAGGVALVLMAKFNTFDGQVADPTLRPGAPGLEIEILEYQNQQLKVGHSILHKSPATFLDDEHHWNTEGDSGVIKNLTYLASIFRLEMGPDKWVDGSWRVLYEAYKVDEGDRLAERARQLDIPPIAITNLSEMRSYLQLAPVEKVKAFDALLAEGLFIHLKVTQEGSAPFMFNRLDFENFLFDAIIPLGKKGAGVTSADNPDDSEI